MRRQEQGGTGCPLFFYFWPSVASSQERIAPPRGRQAKQREILECQGNAWFRRQIGHICYFHLFNPIHAIMYTLLQIPQRYRFLQPNTSLFLGGRAARFCLPRILGDRRFPEMERFVVCQGSINEQAEKSLGQSGRRE